MDEFDLIATYFQPLATDPAAAGLEDDAAELVVPTGARAIVTTDALVEGVHFLPDDPLDGVAKKLLRVNVSDCIAKGAKPLAASLALMWPQTRPVEDIAGFAAGLGEDLEHWSVSLLGGDTVSTPGPLSFALTLHGACSDRGPVRRSGAQVRDTLWVTGAVGDGALGLRAARGALDGVSELQRAALAGRYRIPEPPPAPFADIVAAYATASIDVSDGLIADLTHLASTSGVGATATLDAIPHSDAAEAWLALQDPVQGRLALAAGGDDYQTLFTSPPAASDDILDAAQACGVRVTRIGYVSEGAGVVVCDAQGGEIDAPKRGWTHF